MLKSSVSTSVNVTLKVVRVAVTSSNGFRIVAGLKGAINDDWDYDVSYLYGSTASSQAYLNDMFDPDNRYCS